MATKIGPVRGKKIAARCFPDAERIDYRSRWAGEFAIVHEGNLIRLIRLVDLDDHSRAQAGRAQAST